MLPINSGPHFREHFLRSRSFATPITLDLGSRTPYAVFTSNMTAAVTNPFQHNIGEECIVIGYLRTSTVIIGSDFEGSLRVGNFLLQVYHFADDGIR